MGGGVRARGRDLTNFKIFFPRVGNEITFNSAWQIAEKNIFFFLLLRMIGKSSNFQTSQYEFMEYILFSEQA